MKKVLKSMVVLMIMTVVLTGCAVVDYQVTINRDGSGEIVYIHGYTRESLRQMGLDAEHMTLGMRRRAEEAGFKAESYSGDEIEGFKGTKQLEDIAEAPSLAAIFGSENVTDVEDSNINMERGLFTVKFYQKGIIDLTQMEGTQEYLTINYSINLPVRVGNNNADNVSRDGRTLTWQLRIGEENNIEFVATRTIWNCTYINNSRTYISSRSSKCNSSKNSKKR